ncbi:hypothetical protein AHAS_Ahas04G0063400 [Arachis hypogaea]
MEQKRVEKGKRWIAIRVLLKKLIWRRQCVVYGPHDSEGKIEIWSELWELKRACMVPFVTGGDFNEILEVDDRFGCNTLTQNNLLFREWVEAMELLKLELRDRKYTWYGGRSCSRIDRVFIHVELQECFDIVCLKTLSRS